MIVRISIIVLLLTGFFGLLIAPNHLLAQSYQQITEVPVIKNGSQLNSPWAGGFDAPQFQQVDLNNDGLNDIYAYDKGARRHFTFIYSETEGYIFEPSYALNFPSINSWVLLEDYNCDGITDLITHNGIGVASPKTYKGFFDGNVLKFEFDKNAIFYEGSSGILINLYTVSTHRPIFKDINGDGDKDFLAFDVSLFRIRYYENQRIEKDLPCDSLFFDAVDRCWGNSKETGGITLDMLLGDTCDGKFSKLIPSFNETQRHPGGTIMDLFDPNNDGLYDLIFGDATFERINYVTNNGNVPFANFSEQNDSFPSYDQMVNMAFFPAPHVFDVDNDGDEDLLVAPYNSGAIENFKNVWFYENNGDAVNPFRLQQEDFLVGDMIDVGEFSNPTFYDENNDGLLDLVIGNAGYYLQDGEYLNSLTLYRNTGTNKAPQFTYVTDNYLGLDILGIRVLAPAFGDIDGDGDADLICGESGGKLVIMDNVNGSFENPRFLQSNNLDINVGQFSDPEIVDFNSDGLLDLVIGCRNGNVYYYENTGSSSDFEFTLRTDSLGKVSSVNVGQALGFSSPSIGDFNGDGQQDLLLGGFNEGLKFYPSIGTDFNATFNLSASNFLNETNISKSSSQGFDPRLKIATADISDDGLPEILLGINNGGILFYSQDTSIADSNALSTNINFINDLLEVYPNPTNGMVTINWGESFSFSKNIEINVFNIIGEVVSNQIVSAYQKQLQLDISDYAKGIYLIQMAQDNTIGTIKVMKY